MGKSDFIFLYDIHDGSDLLERGGETLYRAVGDNIIHFSIAVNAKGPWNKERELVLTNEFTQIAFMILLARKGFDIIQIIKSPVKKYAYMGVEFTFGQLIDYQSEIAMYKKSNGDKNTLIRRLEEISGQIDKQGYFPNYNLLVAIYSDLCSKNIDCFLNHEDDLTVAFKRLAPTI